jgi:hypothetical protein
LPCVNPKPFGKMGLIAANMGTAATKTKIKTKQQKTNKRQI